MTKRVLIMGTLDTKGKELEYLREQIIKRGCKTIVLDLSCKELSSNFYSNISCEEVAKAAGVNFQKISHMDRKEAMQLMIEGAIRLVQTMCQNGDIQGVIAVGGANGTYMGCKIMQTLPIGFPKVMISTIASGDVRPYVGYKDIIMIHSVSDISLNRIIKRIFTNAANAIVAMVNVEMENAEGTLFATTMFGVTEPCVNIVKSTLEKSGYEIVVFHAVGTGGMAMEELIIEGKINGVLDITTTELADELCGGVFSAGPKRLEAAGRMGIPQVIAPGAIDMVNFWAPETVPKKYRKRKFYRHNPQITLMRTNKKENKKLGEIIADKANRARGPTAIILPLKGFSKYDSPNGPQAINIKGEPFGQWFDPEADAAFIRSIKKNINYSKVDLVEVDAHINDYKFAREVVEVFKELIVKSK